MEVLTAVLLYSATTLVNILANSWIAVNRRPVKSPPEKFGLIPPPKKSVFMGLNFIPQKFRVVIGSSCRRFLQPKNARLCFKVLEAKTRKTG